MSQDMRTRKDQIIDSYTDSDGDEQLFHEFSRKEFEDELKEAEARGAEGCEGQLQVALSTIIDINHKAMRLTTALVEICGKAKDRGPGFAGILKISTEALTPKVDQEIKSGALYDVIAERERQKSVEGWTPEHDDKHDAGEIAAAAAGYAQTAVFVSQDLRDMGLIAELPTIWPWDEAWFKPTTARRDLVKAAALILAEIERLDRAALKKRGGQHD